MRKRRLELKIRQKKIAKRLGISYQQFQKYERGIDRISDARLAIIGKILELDVKKFYEVAL